MVLGDDLLSHLLQAVPSARSVLTSLFGMGRGVPRRYSHRNLSAPDLPAYAIDRLSEEGSLPFLLFTAPSRVPLRVTEQVFGLLVPLGFAIADFTPAAYRRHRL